MSDTHTPGPWTTTPAAGGSDWYIRAGKLDVAKTQAAWPARELAGDAANARLISAAPDMMEALRTAGLVLHITCCHRDPTRSASIVTCPDSVCREIVAALTKAGVTP